MTHFNIILFQSVRALESKVYFLNEVNCLYSFLLYCDSGHTVSKYAYF